MNFVYEDEYFIAANKKAKQFVHPIPGDKESKNCLLFQVRDTLNQKVFAINRLDRPVSGITLIAKDSKIVTAFQKIWHLDSTQKKYLCLHRGKLEKNGMFDSSLSKKGIYKSDNKVAIKQEAITLYKPIKHFPEEFCTYTQVQIKTGRYHQIRRHFRKAIMPIVGDRKHGKGVMNKHFEKKYSLNQIFLHSRSINFNHPITGKNVNIEADLPVNLKNVLKLLNNSEPFS